MDPNNPTVGLCVQGLQAEAGNYMDAAHLLFTSEDSYGKTMKDAINQGLQRVA